MQDNPKAAEANIMLLSAWNEHDEGHWIEPALDKYGGAEKLDAISRVGSKLLSYCMAITRVDLTSMSA